MNQLAIHLRNTALNALIGTKVLNEKLSAAPIESTTLAATLKRTISRLQGQCTQPDGSVDYAALRQSDIYAQYQALTAKLHHFDPATLTSREERLAFWLNLYNALVVDAVIHLGVRKTVTEDRLSGLTFFYRAAYRVNGQRMSCEDIEHGVLRGNRGNPLLGIAQFAEDDPRRQWVIEPLEARIHFALNCASRSCPPINFYEVGRLDRQLEMATQNFIASDVQLVPERHILHLSKIFSWYRRDFGSQVELVQFIAAHLEDPIQRQWLLTNAAKVRLVFNRYDWALNATDSSHPVPVDKAI